MSEFNRLIDDSCYKTVKDCENVKTVKYITTSFNNLLDNQGLNGGFYGLSVKHELAVPSEKIDIYNSLIRDTITNCQTMRGTDNALPLETIPAKYQLPFGNVEIEDELKNGSTTLRSKKTCLKTLDCNNQDRVFYIFDKNILPPKPENGVEKQRFAFSSRF
jgi:hypothetical protein